MRERARAKRPSRLWSKARDPEQAAATLVHSSLLDLLLRREAEARLACAALENSGSHVLAHRRPVLEPVTRTAADQPQVLVVRVTIDQEIAVGRVLVLADLASDERSVFQ